MTGPALKIRLVVEGGDWLGPGKADLLEAIAENGSISAAGRRMGMSYKRAWSLVETLNAMFRSPLVSSSRGAVGSWSEASRTSPEGEATTPPLAAG